MNATNEIHAGARDASKHATVERPVVRRIGNPAVNVEIGRSYRAKGAIGRKASAPVNEAGAIAPKVAIARRKAAAPVNVEVGTGAIAPKVAIARRKVSQAR